MSKILIFNSVRMFKYETPVEVITFRDVEKYFMKIVDDLDAISKNRSSWQVGFDPKYNVDFTLVNENLETLYFDYREFHGLKNRIIEMIKEK